MEKYFVTHKNYFISVATATTSIGAASLKEKEMVARSLRTFDLYCEIHLRAVPYYASTMFPLNPFAVSSADWRIY